MAHFIENYDCVVPEWQGVWHPLCGFYSKNCLNTISDLLEKGDYRLRNLFTHVKTKIIYHDEIRLFDREGRSFININTSRDYEQLMSGKFGILGDAHAGTTNRQVSLLAIESIERMRQKGLKVNPGDFAENITTQGINLTSLKLGAKLRIGKKALLEVTQIGKDCHSRCHIYYQAGDCVMPKEGIFAKVLNEDVLKPNDAVVIVS